MLTDKNIKFNKNKSNIFVLDTNVLLHDSKSIFSFKGDDIVIPIVVLEELDKFKKGNDLINFQAREFIRILDDLSGDSISSDGISIGEGLGKLYIETNKPFSQELHNSFGDYIPDHKILSVAEYCKNKYKDRQVILVTKDINLRVKAKALGVAVEDYKNDYVEIVDCLCDTIIYIENTDKKIINDFDKNVESISVDKLNLLELPFANQYLILKNENKSILSRYSLKTNSVERIYERNVFGIKPQNPEQIFAIDALLRPEIQLVSLTGKAGTGKTLLALAAALQQSENFHHIYLARPIITLSNRDAGFLSANNQDQILPHMQPLFDNLSIIRHQFESNSVENNKIDELLKSEKLVIEALPYIRGRSLSKAFFIIDDAQNLTPHEIKTIITRSGEGTKVIFTGDIEQIDSPYLDARSNGLSYLTSKMKGQNIFAHINLEKGERSYLAELASNLL